MLRIKPVALAMICNALNKKITVLRGDREPMLDMVNYGTHTMREVKEYLAGA